MTTLWLFNIAMDNNPVTIDDFRIKHGDFAMLCEMIRE